MGIQVGSRYSMMALDEFKSHDQLTFGPTRGSNKLGELSMLRQIGSVESY